MTESKPVASCWNLFTVFGKMGAFTIGGGYAMLPLVEDEMVKRGWMTPEEVGDVIVLAQSAPGVLAVNMAIFTGHRLAGIKGSIAAAIGATLPSFAIILLIAMVFTSFKENIWIQKFFQGVRPVAVALILVPAVRMAVSGCRNWWTWCIAIATLLLVTLLKVSPIWIIVTVLASSVSISLLMEKKK